jgi:hypothetical protein
VVWARGLGLVVIADHPSAAGAHRPETSGPFGTPGDAGLRPLRGRRDSGWCGTPFVESADAPHHHPPPLQEGTSSSFAMPLYKWGKVASQERCKSSDIDSAHLGL